MEWFRSKRDALIVKAITSLLNGIADLLPPPEYPPNAKPLKPQFKAQGAFTGLCPVPRCDYGTKDNICPDHGQIVRQETT